MAIPMNPNGPNYGLIQPLHDNPAYDPTKFGGIPTGGNMAQQAMSGAGDMMKKMQGMGGGGGGGAGGGGGGDPLGASMDMGQQMGSSLAGAAPGMEMLGLARGGRAHGGHPYMTGELNANNAMNPNLQKQFAKNYQQHFGANPHYTQAVVPSPGWATQAPQSPQSQGPNPNMQMPPGGGISQGLLTRAFGGAVPGGAPTMGGDMTSMNPASTGLSSQTYGNAFNQLAGANPMSTMPMMGAQMGGAGGGMGNGASPFSAMMPAMPQSPGTGSAPSAPQPMPNMQSTNQMSQSPKSAMPGRAKGGQVNYNRQYMVGEPPMGKPDTRPEVVIPHDGSSPYVVGTQGPEVFTPPVDSTVIPNPKTILEHPDSVMKAAKSLKDANLVNKKGKREFGGDILKDLPTTTGDTSSIDTSIPSNPGASNPSNSTSGMGSGLLGGSSGLVNMGATSSPGSSYNTPTSTNYGTPGQANIPSISPSGSSTGGMGTPQGSTSSSSMPSSMPGGMPSGGTASPQQQSPQYGQALNSAINQAPLQMYQQMSQNNPQAAQAIANSALQTRNRLGGGMDFQNASVDDMTNYANKQVQLAQTLHGMDPTSSDIHDTYSKNYDQIASIDPGAPKTFDPAYVAGNLALATPLQSVLGQNQISNMTNNVMQNFKDSTNKVLQLTNSGGMGQGPQGAGAAAGNIGSNVGGGSDQDSSAMAQSATGNPNATPVGMNLSGGGETGGTGISTPTPPQNLPTQGPSGSQPLDTYSMNAGIGKANSGPLGTDYTDWRQNQDLRRTNMDAQIGEQQNRQLQALDARTPQIGSTPTQYGNLTSQPTQTDPAITYNAQQQQQALQNYQAQQNAPGYTSSDSNTPPATYQQPTQMPSNPSYQALQNEQMAQLGQQSQIRNQQGFEQSMRDYEQYAGAIAEKVAPGNPAAAHEFKQSMINQHIIDEYQAKNGGYLDKSGTLHGSNLYNSGGAGASPQGGNASPAASTYGQPSSSGLSVWPQQVTPGSSYYASPNSTTHGYPEQTVGYWKGGIGDAPPEIRQAAQTMGGDFASDTAGGRQYMGAQSGAPSGMGGPPPGGSNNPVQNYTLGGGTDRYGNPVGLGGNTNSPAFQNFANTVAKYPAEEFYSPGNSLNAGGADPSFYSGHFSPQGNDAYMAWKNQGIDPTQGSASTVQQIANRDHPQTNQSAQNAQVAAYNQANAKQGQQLADYLSADATGGKEAQPMYTPGAPMTGSNPQASAQALNAQVGLQNQLQQNGYSPMAAQQTSAGVQFGGKDLNQATSDVSQAQMRPSGGDFNPTGPGIERQLQASGNAQQNDELARNAPPRTLDPNYRQSLINQMNDPGTPTSMRDRIGQVLSNDNQLQSYAANYQNTQQVPTPYQFPTATSNNMSSRFSPSQVAAQTPQTVQTTDAKGNTTTSTVSPSGAIQGQRPIGGPDMTAPKYTNDQINQALQQPVKGGGKASQPQAGAQQTQPGRIPLDSKTIAKMTQDTKAKQDLLDQIQQVKQVYNPEMGTFKGKTEAIGSGLIAKLGIGNGDIASQHAALHAASDKMFSMYGQLYKSRMNPALMAKMQNAIGNANMSAPEFKSQIGQLEDSVRRDIASTQDQIKNGMPMGQQPGDTMLKGTSQTSIPSVGDQSTLVKGSIPQNQILNDSTKRIQELQNNPNLTNDQKVQYVRQVVERRNKDLKYHGYQ